VGVEVDCKEIDIWKCLGQKPESLPDAQHWNQQLDIPMTCQKKTSASIDCLSYCITNLATNITRNTLGSIFCGGRHFQPHKTTCCVLDKAHKAAPGCSNCSCAASTDYIDK